MSDMNFPYYMQTLRACKEHSGGFVSSYMSDEDVEKMGRLLREVGGEMESDSLFYLVHNGRSLNDLPVGAIRSESVDIETDFSSKYMFMGERELIHRGYQLVLGADGETIPVVKGKIRPNKHTCYKLLEGIPPCLKKTVKQYREYLDDCKRIIDEQWEKQDEAGNSVSSNSRNNGLA